TTFLVMALFLASLQRVGPAGLAAMNLLVYFTRPDALLLSMPLSLVTIWGERSRGSRLMRFGLVTAGGLALLSAGFLANSKPAVPLAAFLKTRPFSVYDSAYLALDTGSKLMNLAQLGLVLAALTPFVAMRPDRLNVALVASGLLFIGFHAA